MAAITKKLHFMKGGIDNSLILYNSKTDAGNDALALQVDGSPAYAKLGATNDSNATAIRIQKNGIIYAVLKQAGLQHYYAYELFEDNTLEWPHTIEVGGNGVSMLSDDNMFDVSAWMLAVKTQDDVAQLKIDLDLPANAQNVKISITYRIENPDNVQHEFDVDSYYSTTPLEQGYSMDGITNVYGSSGMSDTNVLEGTLDGYFSTYTQLVMYLTSGVSTSHNVTIYIHEIDITYDA